MVFLKSSLSVSKVQPALKTTDSDNQQTDNKIKFNKILGMIWMYFFKKGKRESGENDCFPMADGQNFSVVAKWINTEGKEQCQMGLDRS